MYIYTYEIFVTILCMNYSLELSNSNGCFNHISIWFSVSQTDFVSCSELKLILDFVKILSLPKQPLNLLAEILDKHKVKQVRSQVIDVILYLRDVNVCYWCLLNMHNEIKCARVLSKPLSFRSQLIKFQSFFPYFRDLLENISLYPLSPIQNY